MTYTNSNSNILTTGSLQDFLNGPICLSNVTDDTDAASATSKRFMNTGIHIRLNDDVSAITYNYNWKTGIQFHNFSKTYTYP